MIEPIDGAVGKAPGMGTSTALGSGSLVAAVRLVGGVGAAAGMVRTINLADISRVVLTISPSSMSTASGQ